MAGLGQRLQEARERQGLSLEGLEASTRIKRAYLVALEEEDYGKLPHPTYVKAFLKTYASHLGLDPGEVLELYPQRDLQPIMAPVVRLERPRLGAGFWVAAISLVFVVSGLALYLYAVYSASWISDLLPSGTSAPTREEVQPKFPPISAAASPSLVAPAVPTAPSLAHPTPAPQRVEVRGRAIAATWLWVVVDSTAVFTGTLQPGQERSWVAQEKVFMRVGNAGGLVIAHNGQDRGVLGKNGQVLDVQWTRDSMSFDINPPLPGPR